MNTTTTTTTYSDQRVRRRERCFHADGEGCCALTGARHSSLQSGNLQRQQVIFVLVPVGLLMCMLVLTTTTARAPVAQSSSDCRRQRTGTRAGRSHAATWAGICAKCYKNTSEEARLCRPSRGAAAKEQQQHEGAAHDAAEVLQQRPRHLFGGSCKEKGGRGRSQCGTRRRIEASLSQQGGRGGCLRCGGKRRGAGGGARRRLSMGHRTLSHKRNLALRIGTYWI
jgi:hypothetical protein